jgi:1-deoxy-D-xylulose-5-phosphate synthase
VGGFSSHVLDFLARSGALDRGLKVRPLHLPDVFIDHDKPERMYELAGLASASMVKAALTALDMQSEMDELAALRAATPKHV